MPTPANFPIRLHSAVVGVELDPGVELGPGIKTDASSLGLVLLSIG